MTLDEAIEHCKEKAHEMRISADLCNLGTQMQSECIKCAEEHEQLAEWLTELKEVRELVNRYYNSPITKFVFVEDLLKIVKEIDNEQLL